MLPIIRIIPVSLGALIESLAALPGAEATWSHAPTMRVDITTEDNALLVAVHALAAAEDARSEAHEASWRADRDSDAAAMAWEEANDAYHDALRAAHDNAPGCASPVSVTGEERTLILAIRTLAYAKGKRNAAENAMWESRRAYERAVMAVSAAQDDYDDALDEAKIAASQDGDR